MKKTHIFYSWQSDSDAKFNRYFIENILKKTKPVLEKELSIALALDQGTANTCGSPVIADTIFKKITDASVFVCDVSPILENTGTQKLSPNPNVMIELGYAAKELGWERIIMILNKSFGSPESLPFDIRGRRVLTYSLSDRQSIEENKRKVQPDLTNALIAILKTPRVIKTKLSNFDVDLFNQFKQVLPFNRSIDFLKNFDLASGRWRRDRLEDLFNFQDAWNTPDYSFMDEELEKLRKHLYEDIRKYNLLLSIKSEPVSENCQRLISPTDYNDWFDSQNENHVRFFKDIDDLNKKASEIVITHEKLFKLGREKVSLNK